MHYPSIPNRAGWRRGEGDKREWLFLPAMFEEVARPYGQIRAARALVKHGMLVRDNDGKHLSRPERVLDEHKLTRVYVVTGMLETAEEADADPAPGDTIDG
jgi:hypothetical protein